MLADTFTPGTSFRPKQIIGALRIHQQRRIILADQPGSGKTLQMMLAAELDGLYTRRSNILIATTMTACQLTWAPEIKKRIDSQYPIVFADLTDTGGRKTLPTLEKRDDLLATKLIEANEENLPLIVLVNFEGLRWKHTAPPKLTTLWDIEWDMVVLDESHLVLPTDADEPKKMTQFWYGLSALRLRDWLCKLCGGPHDPSDHDEFDGRHGSGYKSYQPILLPMSGTPDRGKLWHRYGYWKWFKPDTYTDYWEWVQRNFFVTWDERGYNPRTRKPNRVPTIGRLRDERTWTHRDAQNLIRRTKAEMLEGMPEKLWPEDGGVDLPMKPAQRLAYADYQADLEEKQEALVAEDRLQDAQALNMRFALRARQMATCMWEWTESVGEDGRLHETGKPIVAGRDSSNKLDWLLGWLEARGFTEENWDPQMGSVVIVSYFVEVLEWLKLELAAEGISAEILAGNTPLAEKQRIEQQFQSGGLRIVLLSGYLGVSINLDAADDMIFMDMVHDPDRIEQAEDRIHRASRMHHAFYWRLVSQESIDVATVELVDARYRTTRATYEGSRGVEFARRMLAGATRGARE